MEGKMQTASRRTALALVAIAAFATPAQSQQLSQAWAWCRSGKSLDLAVKGCTTIIQSRKETSENRAVAYSNRGNVWLDKKDYDRAIADYNEAIRINPSYAYAFANRGLMWLRKKEYDRALADLDQAISLDTGNPNAYNNRGLTYFRKGDYNRAIVDYNEAIRLHPTHAISFSNRGLAWSRKEDYDQAIADYNQAIRLDPGFADALSGRAAAYYRKNDYVHGDADYAAALALDPKNASVWNGRCFSRAIAGQLQEALADCNEALRLKPDYANALDSRALVYLKLQQFDEAIADYNEALKFDAKLAASLYGRGIAKLGKGDEKDGEADMAAGTAVRPDVAQQFSRYGIVRITENSRPHPPVTTAVSPVTLAASAIYPDRRIALVIGNSAYTKAPALPNPRRDAETVAAALRRAGFQTVTLEADLKREKFIDVLRTFALQAEKSDWALVYFAGHGVEMDGVNYLIPVDASLATDRDVTFEAVPLGQILTAVDGAKKLRLVVLDACRNNPFLNQMRRTVASRSIGHGLGRVEPEAGTLVVYAAKHGELALDGDDRNSPFVEALTNRILTPGIEVRRLFDLVRDDVIAATNRKQQPFSYGSVSGSEDFYFVAR
jgi:tetratricopeptide (TPR) repeat protein